jgi:hypothetical protein
LERLRVERLEDAPKRIGARRPRWHIEKGAEEVGARLGEELEGLPPVGATDRPEQRHRQDVHQRMSAGASDPRVGDIAEGVEQRFQSGRLTLARHP